MRKNGKNLICLFCKKSFYASLSRIRRGQKFHSKSCADLYKKGKPAPNIPTRFIKNDPRLKDRRLENHPAWKNWDNLKYGAKHYRIRILYGKAYKCEYKHCSYPRKTGRGKILFFAKAFEWANVSHEYKQNRSDWIMLCNSCHFLYDHDKLIL